MACVSVALLLAGFVNFGGNYFLVREMSTQNLVLGDAIARFAARLAYALVVSAAAGAFFFFGPAEKDVALAIGSSLLLFSSHANQLALVLPLARRRLVVAGSAQLLDKSAAAVAVVAASNFSETGSSTAPFLMVFGNCVSVMLVVIFAVVSGRPFTLRAFKGIGKIPASSKALLINPWKGSGRIGISSLCFSAQQVDVAIVEFSSSSAVAGEYAAVARATQPTSLVATSLAQAVLPRLTSSESVTAAAVVLLKLWPAFLGTILLAVGGAIWANDIVTVLLGDSYSGSSAALVVLLISTPVSFISQMLFVLLTSRKLDGPVSIVVVTATGGGLLLQVLLPQYLGSVGAAIAFLALQAVLVVGFLGIYFSSRGQLSAKALG